MAKKSSFFIFFIFFITINPLRGCFITDEVSVKVYPSIPTNATKLNPADPFTFDADSFEIQGYATGTFDSIQLMGDLNKFGLTLQITSEKDKDNKVYFSNMEIIPTANSTILLSNRFFGTMSFKFSSDISGLKTFSDVMYSLKKMFGLEIGDNDNPIKIISPSFGYGNGLIQGSISFMHPVIPGAYAIHHLASSDDFLLLDESYNMWGVKVGNGHQICHFRNGILLSLTQDFKNVQINNWIKFTVEQRNHNQNDPNL